MLAMDVPVAPHHTEQVEFKAPRKMHGYDEVIGICHLTANPFDPEWEGGLSPVLAVTNYLRKKEGRIVKGSARVTVLNMPLRGSLLSSTGEHFVYEPEAGFLGNDRATLLVEIDRKRIRVEYFFRVMETVPSSPEEGPSVYEQGYCPTKARVWKIALADR